MEISGIEMIVMVLRWNRIPDETEKKAMSPRKSMELRMIALGLWVICFRSTSIPARNIR